MALTIVTNENNGNDTRKNLMESLQEKVKREYYEWYGKTINLPKKELIEKAHEIMLIENIQYVINYKLEDLSIQSLQKLLSCDNILDAVEYEWLRRDSCFINDLEDAITDFAECKKAEVAA